MLTDIRDKFEGIIDKIFIGVANQELSPDSTIFRAAAAAKKILSETEKITTKKGNKGSRRMLDYALQVSYLIIIEGKDFNEACELVSKENSIQNSSVRQSCCRSLNLNATHWNSMAAGYHDARQTIYNALLSKYPFDSEKIKSVFEIN